MTVFGIAALAMLVSITEGRAQLPDPIPRKLSVPRALFFQTHPEAWSRFLSELPRRPTGPPQANPQPVSPSFGGIWTAVNRAPNSGLGNPLLLTDGTVIVHVGLSETWYKLTPDIHGNYATGSWSQIASLPKGYGPLYFASAVLPDGQVIIQGGEYTQNCPTTPTWTSQGAIYDPIANSWKPVSPPSGSGWINTKTKCGQGDGGIGDAQGIVLPDGSFMLGACCADPDVSALFNATTLTYASTGAPLDNYQDEQGYTLLQNGNVLTIDIWPSLATPNVAPTSVEQYNPATSVWSDVAPTPVSLTDPPECNTEEMGPAVTRPDGSVVAFGGRSCVFVKINNFTIVREQVADPTAIYTASTNSWVKGPNVPQISGSYYTLADAPASLLPNGNILFAASPDSGQPPTHFFEFTSARSSPANSISQVADPIFHASSLAAYLYNFLILPNGQILMTDMSDIAEVYTPVFNQLNRILMRRAAPTITSVRRCLGSGSTYGISGTQFNGLSQGAAYGDDVQDATNYPLVRIANNTTGHVFYARTFGISTMSIAHDQEGSAKFTVAADTEAGPSTLFVVANGIASNGIPIDVSGACAKVAKITVAASPTGEGTVGGGGTFAEGCLCTVTATPRLGFVFVDWTENGNVVSSSADYTFTLAQNVTLIAKFKPATICTEGTADSGSRTGAPICKLP